MNEPTPTHRAFHGASRAGADTVRGTGVVTMGETMALARSESPGPLAHTGELRLGIGGAESNLAIGLARLGVPATWIGRVGADALGELVLREIRAEGVATRAIVDNGAPTGLMIKERRTTARTSVIYYRRDSAGSRLSVDDLRIGDIANAAVLHVTGITPALSRSASDAVDAAAAAARAAGTLVSFDVNYRSALWSRDEARARLRELAAAADLVFAGEDEAEMLLDRPGNATDHAVGLLQLGAREAVVKCGTAGAVTARADGVTSAPAFPVTAVDTVGAGDAFVAGYLHALLRGEPVATRLRHANATGAYACMAGGDWEGAARPADLDSIFRTGSDPVSR